MSASPRWDSLRQTVLDEARLGDGYAHLEAADVPAWVDESNDDLTHAFAEALCDVEDESRERLNALLASLCVEGEAMPLAVATNLLERLRETLRVYCTAQAQRFVNQEGT